MSSSSQFAAPSGAIVGPQFCVPYRIDLTFFIDAAKCDHLTETDINGNVVFKVEAHKWSLRNRQVVVDASGKPVISMQQKLSSIHDRWQVFKGNSSDPKHMLFSVKRSSALQFKTELDVFLAANTEEEVCDFLLVSPTHPTSRVSHTSNFGCSVMQLRSVNDRWQVFKGDSSDPKYLLFSVKRSSSPQVKTVLDVFLAANIKEEIVR
ncbi:unnamed protein product [Musa acuminata subsp. malaccensis]|uniref:(wild Malaysian banana) hypothetical protein n=1 Tax=Musa acuminata subsp. malaccensis TaxID=214687 RepID=A0A804LB15_MUSAM|nr:unnamed protein product [Musa acuminata subsp. malaccensis]